MDIDEGGDIGEGQEEFALEEVVEADEVDDEVEAQVEAEVEEPDAVEQLNLAQEVHRWMDVLLVAEEPVCACAASALSTFALRLRVGGCLRNSLKCSTLQPKS
jgi:hypothetical protein